VNVRMAELSDSIPLQEPLLSRELSQNAETSTCDDGFAALVARQSRFVFGVAFSIVRNPYEAEDVVQELFLKIYRSGAWRNVRDERAFLARAAWRMALDRLPKQKTEPPRDEMPSPSEDPEVAAISADWNATIGRLIDALPEDLRQPLALSALDEMNSRQIASVMGIAEGTVRTRLMRARQMLKQKLAALGVGRHGS
jgi:RNA polymerase sigma-70 factor (ECF subfamily)